MPAFQDLTGQRFGRLVVVSREENSKAGNLRWLCQCDCGNTKIIQVNSLRTGLTKSCGCLRLPDLTGQRFGRLTVIAKAEDRPTGCSKWLCQCDCGNTSSVGNNALKSGHTKSCGCLCRELASKASKTHGLSGSNTYMTWAGMKARCTNPNNTKYKDYGGRGITVCDRWLNSFENFLEDMGECPEGLSLDRQNNNGNYEPENCRWATREEQLNNKRTNRFIEFDGRSQTLAQWSNELGVKRTTISERIDRRRWSIEKALTTPI